MDFGSSLIVPSVQELAKEPLVNVPSRYIRSDQYDQNNTCKIVLASEIPVIDFQILVSGDLSSSESQLTNLHLACKDWGFFQLVNHGISSELVERVKKEVEEFFNLPMEEKRKLWQTPGDVEGFGQAFVVSEEQKLDWNDIFFLATQPVDKRKPHLFPNLPIPFRDTLESYSLELKNLAKGLIGQMEKALGIDQRKEISGLFEDGVQSMRMNYYPKCPQPEKVIGLTPHSDSVGLTILLQVSQVQGLQIKKDGMWVPVNPLPNAFIVNIGDVLEMVTNGIYRSIEHRATVSSEKERISIATFNNPNPDLEIGPVSGLITKETPALYRTLPYQEYLGGLFTRELDGKAYIDAMKLKE